MCIGGVAYAQHQHLYLVDSNLRRSAYCAGLSSVKTDALSMGKDHEILPRQQIHPNPNPSSSSRLLFCQRCSLYFSLKSILFLILSLALFLYALFSLLPLRTVQSEFDATETIKLSGMLLSSYFRVSILCISG